VKELERKRLCVTVLLLGAALYAFVALLLGPRLDRASHLHAEIENARQQACTASDDLRKLQAKEKVMDSQQDLDAEALELLEMLPRPYLVRTPGTIADALKEHALDSSKVTILLVLPIRELPELEIARWNVNIPDAQVTSVGEALADIENRFPMGRLTELTFDVRPNGQGLFSSMVFETVIRP